MEITIQIEQPHRQVELFGPADSYLRFLRQELGVQMTARRGNVTISGRDKNVARAAEAIERMQKHIGRDGILTEEDVRGFLAPAEEPAAAEQAGEHLSIYSHKKAIRPNTKGQRRYVEAMVANDLTFCIGPAGTGKTYLAVAVAVSMLKKKQIRRIVLARPAVEAGEKLGFLPGDIQAKVNPYLRPLFDALEDMMDFGQMRKFMELDIIEVIPLAFMRGRTLNEAVIICDEAQNTSSLQMLMMLTRMGLGSKMIITGDITQVDLPGSQRSGMVEAIEKLRRIKGIGVVELSRADIVRHRLVQSIVRAYGREARSRKTDKQVGL